MKVDLIDHMGSDLDVVNAARVSFDKEVVYELDEYEPMDFGHIYADRPIVRDADKKLIAYLAKHKHWSPFFHCFAKFRIKAPIFVARQLQKHVVGLAWNEVSRRYVDSEPEFYVPKEWRKRAENVKQGSSEDETVEKLNEPVYSIDWNEDDEPTEIKFDTPREAVRETIKECLDTYEVLIESGVCPEQARMVLPQSMYTEWIWSGSLYAFARVCKQRLDSHAQAETRQIAADIAAHMQTLFPVSWKELLNG